MLPEKFRKPKKFTSYQPETGYKLIVACKNDTKFPFASCKKDTTPVPFVTTGWGAETPKCLKQHMSDDFKI